MASDDEKKQDEVVAIELPAPAGWIKKFTPKKGGIRRRNDIVFIAPTGDEITNKRQLERYLKSHTDGPPAAAFDWGLGDSPRRSARLGVKSKASELSDSESPKKRPKKSRLVKETKEKDVSDEEEEVSDDKDAAAEEVKDDAECSMLPEDVDDEEVVKEEAVPKHPDIDAEKKTEQVEAAEEPAASEIQNKTNTEETDAKNAASKDVKKTEQEEVAEEMLASEIHNSTNTENADAKAAVSEDAKKIEQEEVVAEESLVFEIQNTTNAKKADAKAAVSEDAKKIGQEEVAEEQLASEIQNSTNTGNTDANIDEMVSTKIEELKHATSGNTEAKDGDSEKTITPGDKILCEEKEYPDHENSAEKQAAAFEKTNGSEGEAALGNSTKTI